MHAAKEELIAELIKNPPKAVALFLTEELSVVPTLEMRTRQCNRRSLPVCGMAEALSSNNLWEAIR